MNGGRRMRKKALGEGKVKKIPVDQQVRSLGKKDFVDFD